MYLRHGELIAHERLANRIQIHAGSTVRNDDACFKIGGNFLPNVWEARFAIASFRRYTVQICMKGREAACRIDDVFVRENCISIAYMDNAKRANRIVRGVCKLNIYESKTILQGDSSLTD